jgi:phage shock protein C
MTNANAPLRRSRSNRMIAGVVAGLARYFDIDVTLARVIYVLVSICSAAFPGILVYVICWILMPQEELESPRPAG